MLNNFVPDIPRMSSAIIKVIGVGGGGGNAVNHMYNQGIEGVQFYVCNTDAQDLQRSPIPNKIQLGLQLTEGLGAGSEPEMGRKAAMESSDKIAEVLRHNAKMVFVTAGMGGGTGTGAAPVIAKIAREMGILTIGIVTMPFEYEGPDRRKQAEEGIEALKPHVDALLTIINDRVLEMYEDLPFSEAYARADNILCTAAKGIAEIITLAGNVNVDFKDVETAMRNSGRAILGMGMSGGEDRASTAVHQALDSPLLDNMRISGARHLLVNVAYGTKEPLMRENALISKYLQEQAGNNAKLKLGISKDTRLQDELCVTVIATGFSDVGFDREAPFSAANEGSEYLEINLDNEPETVQPPQPVNHFTPLRQTPVHQPEPIAKTEYNRENMNVPAYIRMGIELIEVADSEKEIISRLVLEPDEQAEGKAQIRKGSSFLHDNVD